MKTAAAASIHFRGYGDPMTTINLQLVSELRQTLAGQLQTRQWLERQRGQVDVAQKIRALDSEVEQTTRAIWYAERGLRPT
jgi:hypothetical protein